MRGVWSVEFADGAFDSDSLTLRPIVEVNRYCTMKLLWVRGVSETEKCRLFHLPSPFVKPVILGWVAASRCHAGPRSRGAGGDAQFFRVAHLVRRIVQDTDKCSRVALFADYYQVAEIQEIVSQLAVFGRRCHVGSGLGCNS